MSPDDAEEFTQSLGQIMGGSWRQIALAKRLGVPQALGMDTDEWVRQRLGGYVRMSVDERREAVRELAGEGLPRRSIGEVLGVGHATVNRDLGPNGPTEAPKAPVDAGLGEPLGPNGPTEAPPPDHNHRAQGTGNNEWYTPRQYILAASEVMGGIDLDPATSHVAQQAIQAARFFTREDDGLSKPWAGRVWLNPPYSQPDITLFCRKLVADVAAASVEQAVLLTHNYTDTGWFHEAASAAAAICFTRGRIKFVDAGGNECAPTQGQAFFYFGKSPSAFRGVFGKFGFVR